MGLPQQQQPPHRLRILLVDDHADTRDLLERLLSSRFEIVTAACLASALAAAERSVPDIVISDIGLPDGDGVALMRELHRRSGVAGIAVSGYAIENAKAFREAGFVNWLRKPIQLSELLDALTAAQLEPRTAPVVGLSTT